jgi:hypothetical protein
MATKTKRCTISGLTLPKSEFYTNFSQHDNLHPYCKEVDDIRRVGKFTAPKLRRLFQTVDAVNKYYNKLKK